MLVSVTSGDHVYLTRSPHIYETFQQTCTMNRNVPDYSSFQPSRDSCGGSERNVTSESNNTIRPTSRTDCVDPSLCEAMQHSNPVERDNPSTADPHYLCATYESTPVSGVPVAQELQTGPLTGCTPRQGACLEVCTNIPSTSRTTLSSLTTPASLNFTSPDDQYIESLYTKRDEVASHLNQWNMELLRLMFEEWTLTGLIPAKYNRAHQKSSETYQPVINTYTLPLLKDYYTPTLLDSSNASPIRKHSTFGLHTTRQMHPESSQVDDHLTFKLRARHNQSPAKASSCDARLPSPTFDTGKYISGHRASVPIFNEFGSKHNTTVGTCETNNITCTPRWSSQNNSSPTLALTDPLTYTSNDPVGATVVPWCHEGDIERVAMELKLRRLEVDYAVLSHLHEIHKQRAMETKREAFKLAYKTNARKLREVASEITQIKEKLNGDVRTLFGIDSKTQSSVQPEKSWNFLGKSTTWATASLPRSSRLRSLCQVDRRQRTVTSMPVTPDRPQQNHRSSPHKPPPSPVGKSMALSSLETQRLGRESAAAEQGRSSLPRSTRQTRRRSLLPFLQALHPRRCSMRWGTNKSHKPPTTFLNQHQEVLDSSPVEHARIPSADNAQYRRSPLNVKQRNISMPPMLTGVNAEADDCKDGRCTTVTQCSSNCSTAQQDTHSCKDLNEDLHKCDERASCSQTSVMAENHSGADHTRNSPHETAESSQRCFGRPSLSGRLPRSRSLPKLDNEQSRSTDVQAYFRDITSYKKRTIRPRNSAFIFGTDLALNRRSQTSVSSGLRNSHLRTARSSAFQFDATHERIQARSVVSNTSSSNWSTSGCSCLSSNTTCSLSPTNLRNIGRSETIRSAPTLKQQFSFHRVSSAFLSRHSTHLDSSTLPIFHIYSQTSQQWDANAKLDHELHDLPFKMGSVCEQVDDRVHILPNGQHSISNTIPSDDEGVVISSDCEPHDPAELGQSIEKSTSFRDPSNQREPDDICQSSSTDSCSTTLVKSPFCVAPSHANDDTKFSGSSHSLAVARPTDRFRRISLKPLFRSKRNTSRKDSKRLNISRESSSQPESTCHRRYTTPKLLPSLLTRRYSEVRNLRKQKKNGLNHGVSNWLS